MGESTPSPRSDHRQLYTNRFSMRVLGLTSLVAMLLIGNLLGAPIFLPDPISTAVFTTAGGLAMTAASGATLTVPTAVLVAGKVLLAKKLLIKKALLANYLLNRERQQESHGQYGHGH